MAAGKERQIYLAALEERLRREFIPPHQAGKLFEYHPTEAVFFKGEEDAYLARVVKALCDVMMRKLKVYRADTSNRAALLDVLSCAEALEQLGYRAHGDLGKFTLIQATRINVVKKETNG